MKPFFFLGAVAALDCSNDSYITGVPITGGERIVFDGTAFQAQWSVNNVPGKDIGWLELGTCDSTPPTPACWPAYSGAVYTAGNSQVSFNGQNYVNQWYANAGQGPTVDEQNWMRSGSCGSGGVGPVPTSAPVVTTSTTPTTTSTSASTTTTPTTTSTSASTTTSNAGVVTSSTASTAATSTGSATTKATTTPRPGGVEQQRPTGPTGPNGECVWPAWDRKKVYPGGFAYYVTHKGGVYSLNYYCSAEQEPGVDQCWNPMVTTCTGEAPVVKLTAAELAGMVDPNGPKYQLFMDRWDPTSPSAAEIAAQSANIEGTFTADQRRVVAALQVLDINSIEAIAPGRAENPENVKRVERLITNSTFNRLFPVRHPAYTYANMLKGVGAFPAYCQTYADGRNSDEICLKLLITSFAHNTQEVGANTPSLKYKDGNHMMDGEIHYHLESDEYFTEGEPLPKWKQAFWYLREIGYTEDSGETSPYRKCTADSADSMMWAYNYQCPAGKDYFGRGSKQLSYNYNYGMFSKLFFGDASYLLSNPGLVADSWLNFASGMWFAITPQSPKPSMMEVLDGSWVPNSVDQALGIHAGFGATINILNGGVECDKSPTQEAQNRIEAYKNFAAFFGYQIPASEQLDCSTQKKFEAGGSGDMKMYWGNSWVTPFKCEPVGYQSAFLLSVPGDYQNCVDYWFKGRWVDRDSKQIVGQYGGLGADAAPPV